MTKKLFLTIIVLAFVTTACGQKKETQNTTMGEKTHTLVAYFSCTGTTEATAKIVAEVTGGDLFKIEPAQPYTAADLDWHDKNSRSSVEMQNKSSRPEIANKIENMADYDVIYVGFPIWWYTAPTIINTFIESYDFTGKKVIPFATSGGSSIKQSCSDLSGTYPNINWGKGVLLNTTSKSTIENAIK